MARQGVCEHNCRYLEIFVVNVYRKCVSLVGLVSRNHQVEYCETLFIIKISVAFFFIIAVNGREIGICNLVDEGGGVCG